MRTVLLMVALVLIGCAPLKCEKDYKRLKTICKNSCIIKQNDNVGSTFMFRDVDLTFGKCKCYSKDGKIKEFYISVDD